VKPEPQPLDAGPILRTPDPAARQLERLQTLYSSRVDLSASHAHEPIPDSLLWTITCCASVCASLAHTERPYRIHIHVIHLRAVTQPELDRDYLRLIDSCITQLKAQGPSRTCNESKEEEEKTVTGRKHAVVGSQVDHLAKGSAGNEEEKEENAERGGS